MRDFGGASARCGARISAAAFGGPSAEAGVGERAHATPAGSGSGPGVMPERTASARAIAEARDRLAPEDEHLSARLDDAERATTIAQIDDLVAWLAQAMAGAGRMRPLEYRKLAAVQVAARARQVELIPASDASGPG